VHLTAENEPNERDYLQIAYSSERMHLQRIYKRNITENQ